jgi:S-formylglutathione hydrolase FrmB
VLLGAAVPAHADPPPVVEAPPTAHGAILSRSSSVAPPAPVPALRADRVTLLDRRLQEVTFETPLMRDVDPANPYANGTTRVRILLPSAYPTQPHRRWPVLYLLHGCCVSFQSGKLASLGYQDWTVRGAAERILDRADFITVMPDGLNSGWYTDSYGAAGEGGPAVESYQTRQLIPWVDAHFRTQADRAHRAVAGVSMGGFGAMTYAARHPDLFGFAASFSGAVNLEHDAYVHQTYSPTTSDGVTVEDLRPPDAAFGQRPLEEVRERMHNPVDLAENLRPVIITLDTGNGDKGDGSTDYVEQGVYEENLALHQALRSDGIAHTWDAYGAGAHDWRWFQADLAHLRPVLDTYIRQPRQAPEAFVFVFGEQQAHPFGWHLAATRPYLEMTRVFLSPRHLELEGSGALRVTTPPSYAPSGHYLLLASRNGKHQTLAVTADAAGRLSFTVDTGVASTGQQYRPQTTTYLNDVTLDIRRLGDRS